ncbi:MAG: WYL domain-containing protein [Deltaproteobacteria bacterium]|nr:WYL domain-containing protein [Deltaproteobacteria bacterium]
MPSKSERFTDKTNKLHRLISILRMLDIRNRCTPKSLAEAYGTTERTIYRDIDDLNYAGFAIRFDKEANIYTFADPDFTLRDLNLSEDELTVLLIGRQVAQNLGSPFDRIYQSLMKKVRKDTGRKTQEAVKKINGTQRFWIGLDPMEEFESIEHQYNILNQAMDEKHTAEIVYKAMSSQKEEKRTIAPYGLIFNKGIWYAVAYCSLRKGIRSFALDCIKDAVVTDEFYEIPSEFDLKEYLKPGWQIISSGKPVEVMLRFNKDIARWIKRRKWHPTQIIEEQKDGSNIFKVMVSDTSEIKWWSYNWAPNCEILSPPELRKEVTEDIKKLAKIYEKS